MRSIFIQAINSKKNNSCQYKLKEIENSSNDTYKMGKHQRYFSFYLNATLSYLYQ